MPGPILIVVSDFHLGAGFFNGANILEDFTSDEAFANLLQMLMQESESTNRPSELVINGDFGEFLQVPSVPQFNVNKSYDPADYQDMDEEASVTKLRHLIAGHPKLFDALQAWLRFAPPQRRLVITKGNHDPQWQWPAAQAFLRQRLGATGDKMILLEFPAVGYQRAGVYIEHGNQYAETANRFTNFEKPLDPQDPNQLETPWGSKFVIEFFNQVERDKYWVDGVSPYTALVWFALKYDPAFAFRALAALLRAAPKLVGIREAVMDSWTTNIQTNPQAAAQRFQTDAEYRKETMVLTAHALSQLEPTVKVMSAVVGDEDPLQFAVDLIKEQQRELVKAAEQLAQRYQVSVVLLGHTHRPVNEPLVSGARYINTGAWVWLMDFENATDEQWRDLFAHPARYASRRRLNYARIDYDDNGKPAAQLLEFQPQITRPIAPLRPRRNWLERIVEFIRKLIGLK